MKKKLPPLKFHPVSPSAKRYAKAAGVDLRIKTVQLNADLSLPAFNPKPYACAISTLLHEIARWEADRETGPDFADKTIADCKAAIALLQQEQVKENLLRKIFSSVQRSEIPEEGPDFLPPNV